MQARKSFIKKNVIISHFDLPLLQLVHTLLLHRYANVSFKLRKEKRENLLDLVHTHKSNALKCVLGFIAYAAFPLMLTCALYAAL